jgi:hypothetical protein
MARIAVLIGDLFEDAEYTEPAKAFRKAGHEIVHVGLKKNRTVKGKKKGTPVKIGLFCLRRPVWKNKRPGIPFHGRGQHGDL